ncbi:MAG: processing protein [Patescibacteria group bacterium]|nr:processing protein [Patescibacteria group bacterium]
MIGNVDARDKKRIAIIGSRKMTDYGRRAINFIVEGLVSFNVTIVSGLMYGVDLTAHQVAVKNSGRTIAVVGYGLDYINNISYAKQIKNIIQQKDMGAIISEYENNQAPTKWTFPKRNKLLSEISDAVVVIEAGEKSGSLITVSHALEQGKQVFAVPGSIFSAQSLGTNGLIFQGAEILSNPIQLMNSIYNLKIKSSSGAIYNPKDFQQLITNKNFSQNEVKVLDVIFQAQQIDEYIDQELIMSKTNISSSETSSILSLFELNSLVKRAINGSFFIDI